MCINPGSWKINFCHMILPKKGINMSKIDFSLAQFNTLIPGIKNDIYHNKNRQTKLKNKLRWPMTILWAGKFRSGYFMRHYRDFFRIARFLWDKPVLRISPKDNDIILKYSNFVGNSTQKIKWQHLNQRKIKQNKIQ